jgi:hypothetical protein
MYGRRDAEDHTLAVISSPHHSREEGLVDLDLIVGREESCGCKNTLKDEFQDNCHSR